MNKIACMVISATFAVASLPVLAQDFSSEQFTSANKLNYSYQTPSLSLSRTQSLNLSSPFDMGYIPGKQEKRGLQIRQLNSTKLHFSPTGKLDYGLDFSTERATESFNSDPLNLSTNQQLTSNLSTAAFLNYRINPVYSLNSSIRYSGRNERGTQLSIGAKANKIFGKRHNLTAVFSVNWNNPSNSTKNALAAFDWQQSQNYLSVRGNQFNRTELRIGTNWNWNIDTNWSLSTGISARHMLNSSAKNPFMTQRTPVTIFSVATYRF